MADVYKQSFKQNYTNNIELSIFNCGIERCAPSKTWGPGIRDHYLIHLVLSGKGEFEVGGRTWQVSTGDLFFARPSQLIRYTADEQYPWEYSWVGFNGACAHKLAAQLPFTDDAPVHHTSDPDGMRAALANIYSSRGLQPQDEAAMVGYLYLFIAALMKETIAGKPHSTSSSSQYVLNAIKSSSTTPTTSPLTMSPRAWAFPAATCTGCSCSMWAKAPSTTSPNTASTKPASCCVPVTFPLQRWPCQ